MSDVLAWLAISHGDVRLGEDSKCRSTVEPCRLRGSLLGRVGALWHYGTMV